MCWPSKRAKENIYLNNDLDFGFVGVQFSVCEFVIFPSGTSGITLQSLYILVHVLVKSSIP